MALANSASATVIQATVFTQARQKLLTQRIRPVAELLGKITADPKTSQILIEAALQCSTPEQLDKNDLNVLAKSILSESNSGMQSKF
mgnify:CR=1 FL=1